MNLEYLIACVAGSLLGYVIGVLPGIGASIAMIMLFSVLLKIKIVTVLIFYCCMISAAQFGGSVSVLALNVPGEQNSLPLLKMRSQLIADGQQTQALFLCAAGHLLGAVLTFTFSYILIDALASHTAYLRTTVMVTVSCLGILLSCLVSDSRWYFVIPSCIAAWVLAKIGVGMHGGGEFLTFDNPYLSGGIPRVAAIMGIYAIPKILESFSQPLTNTGEMEMPVAKLSDLARLMYDRIGSVVRGSVTGFFSGLIPFVGVDLSAYLGYYWERLLKKDSLSQITAAETATNAAGISVLLPLLIFGVAIQPSEVVLLEITNTITNVINWEMVKPVFPQLAFWLMAANVISFFLSWNLAMPIMRAISKVGKIIPWAMLAVCCYSIWQIGIDYTMPGYYMLVLASFGAVGYVFRDQDWLPFVVIFMLQHQLEPAIIRLWTIYN